MPADQLPINSGTSVAELLQTWPNVIPLFLSRQMSCVGCSMAAFETLSDVANNYQIKVDDLIDDLLQLIQPLSE